MRTMRTEGLPFIPTVARDIALGSGRIERSIPSACANRRLKRLRGFWTGYGAAMLASVSRKRRVYIVAPPHDAAGQIGHIADARRSQLTSSVHAASARFAVQHFLAAPLERVELLTNLAERHETG